MDIVCWDILSVSFCFKISPCVQGMVSVTIHWPHAGLNAGQQDCQTNTLYTVPYREGKGKRKRVRKSGSEGREKKRRKAEQKRERKRDNQFIELPRIIWTSKQYCALNIMPSPYIYALINFSRYQIHHTVMYHIYNTSKNIKGLQHMNSIQECAP